MRRIANPDHSLIKNITVVAGRNVVTDKGSFSKYLGRPPKIPFYGGSLLLPITPVHSTTFEA